MWRRVVTVLAVAFVGCGGSSRDQTPSPATVVPGSAYIYMEANLDPQGDQEKAVRSVLGTLPGVGAPEQRLQELFNAYAQRRYGRHAANFERDIKPWLGDRIGSFAQFPAKGADVERSLGGLIASVRDE